MATASSRQRRQRAWTNQSVDKMVTERARLAMNTQFGDVQDAKAEARESAIGAVTISMAKAAKTRPAAEMVLNVRPDPIDFRDLFYEPTLVAIKPQLYPPPLEALGLAVRNQGSEGSCTGQALAAVIDLQNVTRVQLRADVPRRVSARMLYANARAFDEYSDDRLPGSSIRGALKGFFHRGVCDNRMAPYIDGEIDFKLTVAMAKDARRVGLGTYLRLRHVLNHYHAAINDADAIICSAVVHDGWRAENVAARGGEIDWSEGPGAPKILGAHAFAIVGYDAEGFIVLNSWGSEWGGVVPGKLSGALPTTDPSHLASLPGMARWSYADWRANVMDAWVMRLTAPTALPSDFAGGYFTASPRNARSGVTTVPAGAIGGHYVNVDDGAYVTAGPFWNKRQTFEETAKFLVDNAAAPASDRYEHVLFYAHGGLNDVQAAAARTAAMVPTFKRNGIFPLFYFWHSGVGETVGDMVDGFVKSLLARTRGLSDVTDMAIENLARPIGRAVWREMKATADLAAIKQKGESEEAAGYEATKIVMDAVARRAAIGKPMKVHFVGHSAGALLLGALLRALAERGGTVSDLIASVSLFAPACTTGYFRDNLQPVADRLAKRNPPGAFDIYNLDDTAERADTVALYRKSLLYLVSNAFEDNVGVPLAGMTRFWSGEQPFAPANVRLLLAGKSIGKAPGPGAKPLFASLSATHGGFDNDPVTMNHLLAKILNRPLVTEATGGFGLGQLASADF